MPRVPIATESVSVCVRGRGGGGAVGGQEKGQVDGMIGRTEGGRRSWGCPGGRSGDSVMALGGWGGVRRRASWGAGGGGRL